MKVMHIWLGQFTKCFLNYLDKNVSPRKKQKILDPVQFGVDKTFLYDRDKFLYDIDHF